MYILLTSTVGKAGAGAAGSIALLFFGLVAIVVGIALWLLPGFIANGRKHHNRGAIWVVTLLLGWTFLGWVAALVWAFTNPPPRS